MVDDLRIDNIDHILNWKESGELPLILVDLKMSVDQYLKRLMRSPMRSLSDVINFN